MQTWLSCRGSPLPWFLRYLRSRQRVLFREAWLRRRRPPDQGRRERWGRMQRVPPGRFRGRRKRLGRMQALSVRSAPQAGGRIHPRRFPVPERGRVGETGLPGFRFPWRHLLPTASPLPGRPRPNPPSPSASGAPGRAVAGERRHRSGGLFQRAVLPFAAWGRYPKGPPPVGKNLR